MFDFFEAKLLPPLLLFKWKNARVGGTFFLKRNSLKFGRSGLNYQPMVVLDSNPSSQIF